MVAITLTMMTRTREERLLKGAFRVTEKHGNYPLEASVNSYYGTAGRINRGVASQRGWAQAMYIR